MKFQTVRVVEKHERLFDPDIDLLAVFAVSVLTCQRFFPIVDFYVGDGTGEEDSIGQSEKQKCQCGLGLQHTDFAGFGID